MFKTNCYACLNLAFVICGTIFLTFFFNTFFSALRNISLWMIITMDQQEDRTRSYYTQSYNTYIFLLPSWNKTYQLNPAQRWYCIATNYCWCESQISRLAVVVSKWYLFCSYTMWIYTHIRYWYMLHVNCRLVNTCILLYREFYYKLLSFYTVVDRQ